MSVARADFIHGQPKTLKGLRMWHWQQLMLHRAEQYRLEVLAQDSPKVHHRQEYRQASHVHKVQANIHLSAVQVLNDVVSGTAERDCAEVERGQG